MIADCRCAGQSRTSTYAGAASGGVWKTGRRRRALGARCSTTRTSSRLARSPSRRQRSEHASGPAPAKRSSAATSRSATASTNRPTPGRPGRAWVSSEPAASRRVVVDPKNADVVFACALGHAYGPQQDRGVYKTADGGRTWTPRAVRRREHRLLRHRQWTRNNPRVLFAGMWQLEIHTWGRTSGGPGSGLFKSVDGGATWTAAAGRSGTRPAERAARQDFGAGRAQQLRTASTRSSKPATACRPTTVRRRRADRCGAATTAARTGTMVSADRRLRGRTHYYTRFAVVA